MKAQSKTIGMAIGVVLIIAIFTGVVLSSRGQAISSEISGNSEGGAALSLANTEDTEIIINEPDNYHEYTKEELFDYYGIEFDISSVFPDMIEENTGSYGIFKFSDGSDMQGHNFIWANPIGNEKVSIEIIKDGAPKSDNTQVTNDSAPLASTISGENVRLFLCRNMVFLRMGIVILLCCFHFTRYRGIFP